MRMVQLGAAFAVTMTICGPAAAFTYSVSSATTSDSVLFFLIPADTDLYVQMTADPAYLIPQPFYYYQRYYDVFRPDNTLDYSNNTPDWVNLAWVPEGDHYSVAFKSGGAPIQKDLGGGYYEIDTQKGQRFYWDNYYQVRGGGDWSLTISDTPFAAVPEPATWALMIAGFGLIGATLRQRPRTEATSYRR